MAQEFSVSSEQPSANKNILDNASLMISNTIRSLQVVLHDVACRVSYHAVGGPLVSVGRRSMKKRNRARARSIVEVTLAIAAPLKRSLAPPSSAPSFGFPLLSVFETHGTGKPVLMIYNCCSANSITIIPAL